MAEQFKGNNEWQYFLKCLPSTHVGEEVCRDPVHWPMVQQYNLVRKGNEGKDERCTK